MRWLQRPSPAIETPGVDLDAMSKAELERLHVGLTRLAALPANELQALLTHVLANRQDD